MNIIPATHAHIPLIHTLAEAIWWPTYQPILSPEQISFMLEKMYSPGALQEQMDDGIQFLLVYTDAQQAIAFAGWSVSGENPDILKIHKLYIMPEQQGKGIGKMLIRHIEKNAPRQCSILELNVNRANPAFHFYKKAGFEVYEEVDIPFYEFFMNDYIMRRAIDRESPSL